MRTDRSDGRDNTRPRFCGCGPGYDPGVHRLPLSAAGGNDHPLCQSHHGPLQCHSHLHLGGTALGRLADHIFPMTAANKHAPAFNQTLTSCFNQYTDVCGIFKLLAYSITSFEDIFMETELNSSQPTLY